MALRACSRTTAECNHLESRLRPDCELWEYDPPAPEELDWWVVSAHIRFPFFRRKLWSFSISRKLCMSTTLRFIRFAISLRSLVLKRGLFFRLEVAGDEIWAGKGREEWCSPAHLAHLFSSAMKVFVCLAKLMPPLRPKSSWPFSSLAWRGNCPRSN